jgi:hypothetical protein
MKGRTNGKLTCLQLKHVDAARARIAPYIDSKVGASRFRWTKIRGAVDERRFF